MNFCTSDTCKLLVLLFAIIISSYLVLTNNTSTETFTADEIAAQITTIYKEVYGTGIPSDKLKRELDVFKDGKNQFSEITFKQTLMLEKKAGTETMIKDAFNEQLGRDPTPSELSKYLTQFDANTLKTKIELVRLIALTPEKIGALKDDGTRAKQKMKDLKVADYELYKKIMDAFTVTLDRLPNSSELDNYFVMMKTKPSFTVDKLKDALISSREHEILEKNQKNNVHGELIGNITERQMKIIIDGIYSSVYHQDPDKFTFDYLRSKFVDFNLDDEKLVRFIKDLKSAETAAITAGQGYITQNPAATTATATKSTVSKYIDTQPDTSKITLERANVNIYDPKSIGNNMPNAIIGVSSTQAMSIGKIVSTVADANNFDKNKLEKKVAATNKQPYADLIANRNSEQSKYVNADSNMVLYPEFKWSVPEKRQPVCYGKNAAYQPLHDQTALIGTLISDAKNTQVGSIMPTFTYKEHTC